MVAFQTNIIQGEKSCLLSHLQAMGENHVCVTYCFIPPVLISKILGFFIDFS